MDLEIDAGQGDDPGVADVMDLVDTAESDVRARTIGSILRRCRGSLVLHPGHSGSPRRTALIDERSSARVAATTATAAATAITIDATINAATSITITGDGNDVETVRSSGAVASRTTTSPSTTPAIEATPIRTNCSRAIVPRSAGDPAPIARSDANSKSRRRCAKYSVAVTPAITRPSPATAAAASRPTARLSGASSSRPSIVRADRRSITGNPAAWIAAVGSVSPCAQTSFTRPPSPGTAPWRSNRAGPETTMNGVADGIPGNDVAVPTRWIGRVRSPIRSCIVVGSCCAMSEDTMAGTATGLGSIPTSAEPIANDAANVHPSEAGAIRPPTPSDRIGAQPASDAGAPSSRTPVSARSMRRGWVLAEGAYKRSAS